MTVIVDLLQQIGLNKYEAEAYYVLLQRGAMTGYEVGKHSQVPLSRSYEILERLLEKGFVLLQPGEPPRYSAQDPDLVLRQYRSQVENTLDVLSLSLSSLVPKNIMNEFWVIRGQQNILTQMNSMISNALITLDLLIPSYCDVSASMAQAYQRGCRVFQPLHDALDSSIVLLVSDGREALVGTVTSFDTSQVVVSSNAALLDALQGYFQHRRLLGQTLIISPAASTTSSEPDWMDWEIRKQRRLKRLNGRDYVA